MKVVVRIFPETQRGKGNKNNAVHEHVHVNVHGYVHKDEIVDYQRQASISCSHRID